MQATINGIRMNYEVAGSETAPVIVLHHPLATNLNIWDEITPVLTPRFGWVRFDARRAHGKTEATKRRLQLRDADGGYGQADGSPQDRARAFPWAVDGRHGRPVSQAAEA